MIDSTNVGQMAAVIMSANAIGDEARAIQALSLHGFRSGDILADLDAAMDLAKEWSTPVSEAA